MFNDGVSCTLQSYKKICEKEAKNACLQRADYIFCLEALLSKQIKIKRIKLSNRGMAEIFSILRPKERVVNNFPVWAVFFYHASLLRRSLSLG